MNHMKKKAKRQEKDVPGISNWSELCPDLLRCVFKRLSVLDLNRAKLVSSSWHTASRGCLPKPNQIPWLILFNNMSNSRRCVLFVPDDKDKVYKTQDLGIDFVKSRCLATYSSWLLMSNLQSNLYILNPLTGERIDLPNTKRDHLDQLERACLWIENKTKEYLVVLLINNSSVFSKNGDNKWHEFYCRFEWIYNKKIVYNHKNQKLYVYGSNDRVKIWDFSGDKPRKDGFLNCFRINQYNFHSWKNLVEVKTRRAVTLSGDFLTIACCTVEDYNTWRFQIYKANQVNPEWVKIDSLGDEALILDMGTTVVAKDIPGIKKNSIYFSGLDNRRNNPDNIFVYDLTTQKMEPLPQCIFSSIRFSEARWFFPDFNG